MIPAAIPVREEILNYAKSFPNLVKICTANDEGKFAKKSAA